MPAGALGIASAAVAAALCHRFLGHFDRRPALAPLNCRVIWFTRFAIAVSTLAALGSTGGAGTAAAMFRGDASHLGLYESPAPTLESVAWRFQRRAESFPPPPFTTASCTSEAPTTVSMQFALGTAAGRGLFQRKAL